MTARWTQRNPQWTWLAAVATLLFVDQVSKSFFSTTLELGEAVQVTEWLNFVHVLNTGAAFSLLADAGGRGGVFNDEKHHTNTAQTMNTSARLKAGQ